ncbi:MAG TPA: DNA-directed RNA polymerase subunit K [Candidatus Nanoarchaeia archaeon]|nr:DNA-directed RNA polymerase subunit K [Candidatus Nanoarchaeia archaeon]
MTVKLHETFTKYEIARIIGARALQIAMDAPVLLKITKEELESMRYDPLKIAEREFESDVLPISVYRPLPKKRIGKLLELKEEKIDDEKIIAKEKEIEEEMSEKAVEQGFVEEDDSDTVQEEVTEEGEQ